MPQLGEYVKRASAEFVGTFAYVFIGAGSILYAQSLTDIGLAEGLVIAVMFIAVAHISGGHFNPAITLAHLVTRRIGVAFAGVYVVTQLVAGIAAAALLKWVLPTADETQINLGAPKLQAGGTAPALTTGAAVVVEALLTFFLVWVFFAVTIDPRGTYKQVAGLAIGFVVTADVLMGGILSGGMMNPARALGPELIGHHWTHWWVWYLGPLAGAAVAAVLYELLFLRPDTPEPAPRADDTALS